MESETEARPPLRPHEQPWADTPRVMHGEDLPEQAAEPDLPFFRTSEIPRKDIEQWDRHTSEGVPTGLPPLVDLEDDEPPIPAHMSPAQQPANEAADEPVRGAQLILAGAVIGGILGSVFTYWFAVGF